MPERQTEDSLHVTGLLLENGEIVALQATKIPKTRVCEKGKNANRFIGNLARTPPNEISRLAQGPRRVRLEDFSRACRPVQDRSSPDLLMKIIAIDVDDVLNNFTETLQQTQFVRDETHALSEEMFQDYLAKVRSGWSESGGLLSTEYSFFRSKIHQRCYELAQARSDGVRFAMARSKKAGRS